ncbi:MAG: hypothetical protein K9W42_05190 [Candidatus Heimdallarchaeota archaeon]|nr:hypothetical protein [Candidatus Heimdallarchaeota archaeon]
MRNLSLINYKTIWQAIEGSSSFTGGKSQIILPIKKVGGDGPKKEKVVSVHLVFFSRRIIAKA